MSITVIIATCGRPDRLEACLGCLRDGLSDYGVPEAIVVVDNHESGNALPVVARWRERGLPVRGMASRFRDKATALNTGIREAKTTWLAFTDDDTQPWRSWLAEGMKYASATGLRVFGGRVIPGDDPPALPRWLRRGPSGLVPGIGVHVAYAPLPSSGVLPPKMTAPFGANLFVHRDIFQVYGGYDERLWRLCEPMWPVGCEDSEFGYRLHCHGEPIGYCREAVVIHPVNIDRASLKLHLWRAYCEGWRQPLIFMEDYTQPLELFRVKLLMTHLWKSTRLWFVGDQAGSVYHLVEAIRFAGASLGRWSGAFKVRRLMGVENKRGKEI